MSTSSDWHSAGEAAPTTTVQFLDTMQRTRIAMADASGGFTDAQLCQIYQLTQAKLAALRDEPTYQHAYTEQINKFQAMAASRYFELQVLGDMAMANARHYLEQRSMVKENLDMTKFVLSKLLPNPEQAVKVTTNEVPQFSVAATIVLNERLPGYAKSLEGVPTIDLADDPNLRRPGQP